MLTAGIAGCLGDDESGTADHPALDGPDGVPRLGPSPEEAEGIVVAFEDPSCSSCATFAAETFPQLRDGPIEDGRVSYLWRSLPWVEPDWSRPAINGLYDVHEQDSEAFWELKGAFYDGQGELNEGNVREWTESEVESLSIDSESVVSAMEEGRYDDRIDAVEGMAEESEVTAVPSFVLFEGGEYVTTVVGPQSYDVFEGALDL